MPRQSKIAASQLARKLKLEKQFKPLLTRFFNQLSRDINITWAATQNIPSMREFEPDLIALLRNHYRKVAKAFNGEVRKEAKHHNLILDTKAAEETINDDVMKYILAHSVTQSGIILGTTQKELQQIVSSVLLGNAVAETQLSNIQVGNELKKRFVDRMGSRVDTIAITETNMVAERVKYIEANTLAQVVAQQPAKQTLVDTWNTTLDEKTRASHVAADRQEIPHGRAFTVQGQLLRYPGDMSLGASLDNVINCRCASIVTIEGNDAAISLDAESPLIFTR